MVSFFGGFCSCHFHRFNRYIRIMYIVCMDEVNRSMTRRDTHKNAQISSFCSMFPRISKFCVFVMFFLLCFQSWFIKVKQTHFPDACICTDRKRHSIHNHLSYVRMSKEEDEKKSQSETRAQYIFELCENGKANSTQRTSAFFFDWITLITRTGEWSVLAATNFLHDVLFALSLLTQVLFISWYIAYKHTHTHALQSLREPSKLDEIFQLIYSFHFVRIRKLIYCTHIWNLPSSHVVCFGRQTEMFDHFPMIYTNIVRTH